MSIIIGSARINENGHATGGASGDQKQKSTPDYSGEISMQTFYVSNKGWYVLRPKSAKHAKKIAENMKTACNNKNIGYDQNGRNGVIKYGVATKTKTEADCSSLVRACIKEATGKDPGDFYTGNEATVLEKTKLFEARKSYVNGMKLYDGDVLVTKTKGHTVIVVSGNSRDEKTNTDKKTIAKPTLREGSQGYEVGILQKNLNEVKKSIFSKIFSTKLVVDGEFGPKTKEGVKSFQKKYKLELVDGIYGPKTAEKMGSLLK